MQYIGISFTHALLLQGFGKVCTLFAFINLYCSQMVLECGSIFYHGEIVHNLSHLHLWIRDCILLHSRPTNASCVLVMRHLLFNIICKHETLPLFEATRPSALHLQAELTQCHHCLMHQQDLIDNEHTRNKIVRVAMKPIISTLIVTRLR